MGTFTMAIFQGNTGCTVYGAPSFEGTGDSFSKPQGALCRIVHKAGTSCRLSFQNEAIIDNSTRQSYKLKYL